MKLAELTTPYERRRVIVYGANGNPVRHWYDVRLITPPYYMGNVREEHGDRVFDLFLFLPGVKDGVIVRPWVSEDRYDLEVFQEDSAKSGVHDKDSYIAELNRRMVSEVFIGTAQIEFVRQWDSERAADYTQYRAAFYAKREEQDRQRQAEAEAKEAARQAEAAARKAVEDKAARAKYLGWADKMAAFRFRKVHACMETLIRDEGKLMARRDFVISRVREGWMPEQADDVTGWYRGRETKPRTEYRLRKMGENCYYTVTKTELEFAKYIIEHEKAFCKV